MPAGMNIELLKFQFTLPLRGVTVEDPHVLTAQFISIHTPLAGSDLSIKEVFKTVSKFQSTLPLRGVTWFISVRSGPRSRFQSTLPLRGVTEEHTAV